MNGKRITPMPNRLFYPKAFAIENPTTVYANKETSGDKRIGNGIAKTIHPKNGDTSKAYVTNGTKNNSVHHHLKPATATKTKILANGKIANHAGSPAFVNSL